MLVEMQQLGGEAAKLAAAPLWPLADNEITDVLRAAYRLEQTAAALQARLVHEAGSRGLPQACGRRSTASWLRDTLLLDPHPARELTKGAAAMQRPALQEAVLDGRAALRQATAIAATCDAIPADVADLDDVSLVDTTDLTTRAETRQLDLTDRLTPFQLRRVGERILAHVAPDIGERAEALGLARQETRAQARRGLTLSLPADGLVRISGHLGIEDAATVQAALHPLCTPVSGDGRSPAQRRADALTDVCKLALRTGELPDDGGEPPQLAVTVAFDPLTAALSTATTDEGERLSSETVRRLACDCRILPLVLGGAGQILDAGRTRRLATGPLRRALAVRDGGCAYPDCPTPPRWTDGHHIVAWSDGGATSLDNLVLLCRPHHRLIHDPLGGWQIRPGDDGRPDFIPPPILDHRQRPRRNLYHPRI